MKVIELDASKWKDPVEFYDAVYDALGDPHAMPLPHKFGHSIDALLDVTVYGGMAYLEPPYVIRIAGLSKAPAAVSQEVALAASFINRLGMDVEASMVIVRD